ncbi:MAG TPA: DUF4386 family protein [Rectinemataceae bacterium]|nr:DUF4386 family protein [Rectinemataceae bacterium]
MDNEKSLGPSFQLLFRIGAIAAFAFMLFTLVPLVLMITQPLPPYGGGAALLDFIAAHPILYITELVCFTGLSIPAIVFFLALGVALWPSGRDLALLGAVVGIGSEIAALAFASSPPSLNGGLLGLSAQYQAASEGLRPSIASAAGALQAYANGFTLIGVLTALGIFILSIPMLKSGFPRWVSILGLITGGSGMILEATRDLVGPFYALYGILLLVWPLGIGLGLLRLSMSGVVRA